MEMSVSSETTFFSMKLQPKICPHLRTGSSAEDRGRIDTRVNFKTRKTPHRPFLYIERVLFAYTLNV